MDTQSIREAALSVPRKQQDLSTPFWPGTDGHVAISDVPLSELTALSSLAKVDAAAYSAALACKVLINKENGEHIFADADRDVVGAHASTLQTIVSQINEFFGFTTKTPVQDAKND